jgi:hypothetical protein
VNRTLRATLLAGFLAFAAVAGTGAFLGFGTTGPLVAGLVAALVAALLLWGASRRSATFHGGEVPPVEPGFPGPPDRPDGSPADDPDDRPDR